MTPNTFTPSALSQSAIQAFEAVTEPRERVQAGRDKFARLRQRESTLRALAGIVASVRPDAAGPWSMTH